MPENNAVIGLSWKPRLPETLLAGSSSNNKSTTKSQISPKKSGVYNPNSELIDGLFVPPNDPRKLNKLRKKEIKDTAGKNWFDMSTPAMTPELKKDLQLLKLRSVMDPKRHYKKGDAKSLPKYFQVGTIVESASEYFSGRLSKKERKATIADELLYDHSLGDYRKRKVREIEEQRRPGGVDKWKIKGRQSLKRAKQRRH